MNLQELLTQNPYKITPGAIILIKQGTQLTAQKVDYQPEVINLGVVLLGYYTDSSKIKHLSKLGDCLSVGHYVEAPRTLKYGRNFTNNPKFKALPAKIQKHLAGEIQDCTISFVRDYGIDESVNRIGINDLQSLLKQNPSVKSVYLYRNKQWQILRNDGYNLANPVSLRSKIQKLLRKKS